MRKQRDTDARTLPHQELTELRIRGVKACQAGQAAEQVAAALGVNRTTIYDWLALFKKGGWAGLQARKRGGKKAALTERQVCWVVKTVVQKNPRQLQFAFALWTRELVRDLIFRKFNVSLSLVSVGRLLKAAGMSAQRPLFRAWQQNPERVDAWLKEEYPQIQAEAKKHRAEIYFGDEAGVRSDQHSGTTWGVRGSTPVVKATGARFGLNMISAVSPRGNLRFMVVDGKMNAERFIQFLRRLLKNAKRLVYLIVDGHPSHKARKVEAFVESTHGRLRLFCLPPYSPELNPDELVWNHLKNHHVGKQTPANKQEIQSLVLGGLRKLQQRKDLVKSFFRHPETSYAA
jgi:transposase